MQKHFCRLLTFCLLGCLAPFLSLAQEWPAKAIRLVVPYPAGGGVDAGNPKAAEIALPTTTVAVRIAQGLHHPLVGGAEEAAAAAAEASGVGLGQAELIEREDVYALRADREALVV